MALKLKSFAQLDLLKKIHSENLIPLLEPFRLFLEMKGFTLPASADAEIDATALGSILAHRTKRCRGTWLKRCTGSTALAQASGLMNYWNWPQPIRSKQALKSRRWIWRHRFGSRTPRRCKGSNARSSSGSERPSRVSARPTP